MAIRTFNSVGGFSVGEIPVNIISNVGEITGPANANITGTVYACTALRTDSLLHLDGTPWDFQQPAGAANGQIQYYSNGDFGASANLSFTSSNNYFYVGGNANVTGNITTGNITASGTVTAPDFYGNIHGDIIGNITAPGGAGSNTYVVFNDNGYMNALAGFTFNKSTNAMSLAGNLTAGNVSATLLTGTLTTAAQPNITSVGTLTSANISGNANVTNTVNTGNLNVTAKVISSLIPSSDNTYDLGSSSLQWKNVYAGTSLFVGGTSAYIKAIGNVIQTEAANVANNISVGSITVRGATTLQQDLTVSGNLTVGGSTTYINVTNTSIKDPLIDLGGSGNGANATSYDGKDRGLILHNYKSDGSAPVNEAFVWKTANSEFQAFSNVTDYTGEIVTGTLGNIRANVMFANITGQILTASQTNITDLGTLNNLAVAGNITTSNATVTGTFKASGLTYPGTDGTAGQVLETYGNGQLYWTTIDTWRIQNASSNLSVLTDGNIVGYVNTSEKFKLSSTGATVTGQLSVSGNVVLANTGVNYGSYTKVDNLQIQSYFPNGAVANVSGTNVVTTVKSATVVTAATTPNIAIAIVPSSGIRGVEFFVKGEDSAGAKYTVATVSAVHNGTSVDYAVYGTVNLPSSDTTGKIVVNYSSGNIRLEVTPASSNSTVWTTQYRTI